MLHGPEGPVEFVVFEKNCECLFIPNCASKIISLLVGNTQVTISVTLQYFTCHIEATSYFSFMDEN